MRLSTKSEYACLALITLASHDREGRLVSAAEIARGQSIPKRYLEQILLSLKRSGYVHSHKGVGGGYRLAKAANRISLAEIIRLMDGALAPVGSVSTHFFEHTPIERSPKLIAILKDIRDYIADTLEKTTFADVL